MEDFEFGSAISFDGDDDYIEIPYDTLFNVWNSAFTAELWFSMITKPVSPDSFYILLKRGENVTNTSQIELALGTKEGFMGSVWDDDGIQHTVQYGSMNTLNEGQWYHLALAWDGDSLRLFVNSVLRDSKSLAGALRYDATQPLAIGSNAGQNAPFYGMIDEVRFSRIARQSWEFRVNHSQLVVVDTVIHFGNVWIDETRMLPFRLRSGGSEPLEIKNITISPSSDLVDIPFSTAYYLQVDQDTTIWLSFTPHSQVLLDSEMRLVIQSSDPTFPDYEIPVRGEGVSTLPAGAYSDDPFTFGLWHLDESFGDIIYDASAYEMHGTWNGLERLIGKFNLALLFPAGYDYIGVIRPENDRYISPRWGGFTVEAWFFIEDIQQNRGVLVRRGTEYNSQFDLALNNDTVEGI
ncbi:LamG domain-containing protein, partial [bacterium]|nr:LamG domain-containing protein [bacterium]